jgi:putative ABC transport system permease protein
MMRSFLSTDLRYGLRRLLRARAFTLPAAFALAFGTGLGLSLFSLVRFVSLRPLLLESVLSLDPVRDAGWESTWNAPLRSAAQIQNEGLGDMLFILVVVAGLGLVIALLGLISLVLARASGRRRDLAIEAALGASSSRLRSRLLSEGVWLAFVGCGIGLLLGLAGTGVLRSSWPHSLVPSGGSMVELWGLVVGLLGPATATVLLPLIGSAKLLRSSNLGSLGGGARTTGEPGERLLRDVFAVVQLAVSVALLIGAGLLVRSAFPVPRASGVVESRDTLIVELELTESEYGSAARRLAYFDALLERVAGIPGIEAESLSSPAAWLAVGPEALATAECGNCSRGGMYLPMSPAFVRHHAVSPGFFAAFGLDLVDGRGFTPADRVGSPRVAIVNRTFATEHFERGEPLGRRVQVGGLQGPWYTVVGVVEDVQGATMGSAGPTAPALSLSLLQQPPLSVDLSVRTADGHLLAGTTVTNAVSELDGPAEIVGVATTQRRLGHHIAPLRWLGLLFGVTGGLATLLAVHGLYSVMRYNVLLRRRELGIRMAVGAKPRAVVGMVLRRSLLLVAIGGAVGLWGALPLIGWLKTLAPDVRVLDPVLFGGVTLLLALAALAGGTLPARGAARLDPVVTLRDGSYGNGT